MKRGFTLVELLVVIVIISILMALVIPIVIHVIQVARQGTSEALASQLETVLKSYELQDAVYPPGDGSGTRAMVEALRRPGSGNLPLFEPKPDMLTPEGDLIDPVQHDAEAPINIFHYRNNRGRKPGPDGVGRPGIAPRNEYDLWAAGMDYDAKRPDSAWSIRRP